MRSLNDLFAVWRTANYPNWKFKESRGLAPAREIIITDAISKAEEIMRQIEKNYPPENDL
jgi:hypothetical protein